ncbi:uncharacterized protein LOC118513934 [Anopheles stephensi]|uniref:uncharacterized protein LOC118513934 n=1 Tax=Anopheles stephensi TaxID=30069 RepID=UPI0016588EDF|nr:uncharacterized protein LOC118513934 [Anopheles stephensi]XP_035916201.1 uncharacterized protein LOC118513934 [Anopheles stephensi]XP_035916202.1 uncharacterized protein LOC118513934 [Anopheles stephensi]XP_035916203.1 uncharacterized protein LOC118513934 [Anopheles stephensi]XP_035916204.1 uncharacterized protein LOC118513934 [Anopheles stephensi]XP_035916205.1 uncharacterized protein LOC118513934 [Anopheles stephensi]
MRRNRVLPSCCAVLLIVAVLAEATAAAAHGHGSVETLLAHDITANIEAPRDDFNNDLARNFHSPRLEYNEWLPVGRGDPLKNDPTYDYSPPVLDRVRYWSDGAKDKTSGNDILLLGVPSKKSVGINKEWNSVPVRRNYYSSGHQHHAIASPNQLPHTVLMPPPLNNFLGGTESVGFWGGSASASQQRVDTPPGDGFKYRPASSYPGQFSGGKHPDPPITQPITAQFHHHHQPQLQSGSGFNRPQQQPYVTTIRLTTPAGDTVKRPLLKTILQNEHSYPFTKTAMTSTVTEYTSGGFYDAQNINAMAQTIFHPPQTTEYLQPQPLQQQSTKTAPKLSKVIHHTQHFTSAGPFVTPVSTHLPTTTTTTTTRSPMTTSTMSPMITTQPTPPAMTTDSIFSHYKQPATPERWSPYLIIEGHSKVKTYGLNTNDTLMQLPRMVPVTSTKDPIVRHVVNRDPNTGAELSVTHIATKRPPVYEVHTQAAPRPAKTQGESSNQQRQPDDSAVNTLLTLLDEASFDGMLQEAGPVDENALDGSATTSTSKDSKTRRNVRVTRQIYRLNQP